MNLGSATRPASPHAPAPHLWSEMQSWRSRRSTYDPGLAPAAAPRATSSLAAIESKASRFLTLTVAVGSSW